MSTLVHVTIKLGLVLLEGGNSMVQQVSHDNFSGVYVHSTYTNTCIGNVREAKFNGCRRGLKYQGSSGIMQVDRYQAMLLCVRHDDTVSLVCWTCPVMSGIICQQVTIKT